MPLEWFFWDTHPRGQVARQPGKQKRARAICAGCPVRQECLDAAMKEEIYLCNDHPMQMQHRHGVRGGLTPSERAALAGRAVRRRAG